MGVASFALRLVLLAVAFSSFVQAVPQCDPETKVPLNVSVNTADFITLSSIPVPDTCSGFDLFALADCQGELGIGGGCCDPKCAGVFDIVTVECLSTFFALICGQNPDLVPILETLSSRCKDGFTAEGCGAPDGDETRAERLSEAENGDQRIAKEDPSARERNAALESRDADSVDELSRDDDGAGSGLSLYGTLMGVAALLAMVVP